MVEQAAVTVKRAARFDYGGAVLVDKAAAWDGPRSDGLAEIVADGNVWVARQDGEVVAFAVFTPTLFRQWFIEQVIVHPDYRRRGIGTMLVRQCEEVCGGQQLFAAAPASNEAMRGLLAKLDYQPSGQVDNIYENDPLLIYTKRLG